MQNTATAAPDGSVDTLASALGRWAASVDDPDVEQAVLAWSRPVRVGVSGRPGSGKSTLIAALGDPSVVEVHGVDAPGGADPDLDHDVLVHVVARAVTESDRAVSAHRGHRETALVAGRPDLGAVDLSGAPSRVSTFRSDDLPALRAWMAEADARARARRDVELLADLERAGAARPSSRATIETFLRGPEATAVRRRVPGRRP